MTISRHAPILPIELLESYNDEQLPLYHPVRGTTCIKQLNRLSIMLKQEVALLQKIRYKQKNQHKSATWWRHVSGSQRAALRLLEQLNDSLIPHLPTTEDKQPVLAGSSLFRLTESSLRVLLVLDRTSSFHTKSAAAVQQLLRAALFMPLAMTLKALIARLHTIWVCLKDELQVFLTLLKSSPKKKSNLAMDLDAYATHLPRELSRFWKTGSTKGTKGGKDASASVSASASSSAMPSRTQSPMTSRPVEGGKMSNASKLQSQINSIADSDMNDMTASPATAVDSPSSTVLEPVAVPIPTKKAKKRKRPVAGDDIDAIFAGL